MTKKLCSYCHLAADGSNPFGLVKAEDSLCRSCHADKWKEFNRSIVHSPVLEGDCTACHAAHASDEKFLIKENKRELCSECHTDYREVLEQTVVHEPVLNGECEVCHDPHASETASLLKADVIEICKRCHSQQHTITHPFGEGVVDPRDNSRLDCVSCHDPHASGEDYLLYYRRERELCIQCHKDR